MGSGEAACRDGANGSYSTGGGDGHAQEHCNGQREAAYRDGANSGCGTGDGDGHGQQQPEDMEDEERAGASKAAAGAGPELGSARPRGGGWLQTTQLYKQRKTPRGGIMKDHLSTNFCYQLHRQRTSAKKKLHFGSSSANKSDEQEDDESKA